MARTEFFRWIPWLTAIALVPLAALGVSIVLLPLEQSILAVGVVSGLLLVALASLWFSIPLDELVLLFLVAGTVAFDRTFSYLALEIRGVPLYVTELGMAILIVVILLRNALNGKIRSTKTLGLDYAILAYLALGSVNLLRTLSLYGVQAIKDFAIIYYALFFFLVIEIVQTATQLRRVLLTFLGGAVMVLILGISKLAAGTGESLLYGLVRYLTGQSGMYLVIAAIIVLCLQRFLRSQAFVALALLACVIGIFLSQQRSVWIAFAVTVGLIVVLDAKGELVPRALIVRAGVAIGLFVLLVFLLAPFQNQTAQFVESSTTRLIVGLQDPLADPTAAWRLAGWEEAINSFLSNPILGTGFGEPFDWYSGRALVENRPHNTYLTILIKTGLTGIVPFLFIVLSFYWYALRAFWRATDLPHKAVLLTLIAAHVGLSVFGIFNLLLESPYLAIFYWGIMGVLVAVEQRRLVFSPQGIGA